MLSWPRSPKLEGSKGKIWQVQEAGARFCELLEVSLAEVRRSGDER